VHVSLVKWVACVGGDALCKVAIAGRIVGKSLLSPLLHGVFCKNTRTVSFCTLPSAQFLLHAHTHTYIHTHTHIRTHTGLWLQYHPQPAWARENGPWEILTMFCPVFSSHAILIPTALKLSGQSVVIWLDRIFRSSWLIWKSDLATDRKSWNWGWHSSVQILMSNQDSGLTYVKLKPGPMSMSYCLSACRKRLS
jgi:hypothetical protein